MRKTVISLAVVMFMVVSMLDLVWSKISNALKGLGFRSHNFLAQLLSETHMVKIFDRFEKAQLAPRTQKTAAML